MKICCTILLGPGSESTVADAIASVREQVDGFLLIESGGGMKAVRAAAEAMGSDLLRGVREYAWLGDYGAARQFALDTARDWAHADYALTLDPDERVELAENLRYLLAEHPLIDVWSVKDRDEGYYKERLIRCASDAKWHGTVCENVECSGERARVGGQFWELPKTEAQTRARHERGVIETAKMISAGDDRYKWHRHRGSCLMGLGRKDEALESYRQALARAESSEDRAWCSYLICEQLVLREQCDEARSLAAQGLADHAGFLPEFGWIIAYVDFKRGAEVLREQGLGNTAMGAGALLQNASRWAQMCLNLPPDRTRVSFRGKNCKLGCQQILSAVHATRVAAVIAAE